MSRARILLCLLTTLGFLAPAVSKASLVWRPGEGWSDESGGDVSASSSRDQLEMAHKLEAQGARDDALKAYKNLLRRWPLSFFAPEAQFRIGKITEDEGDFYSAFQSFQKMVTKYPSSNYFDEALGEQYRIANLYLNGEPQKVWKIPVGPSMDRTVEMYQRIIQNAPYGTYAPQCQFKIGLARENQRRYTDAVDAYQKVIDNYPTSDVAADGQYQIGYAWMRASMTGDYDQGAAKKAIEAFQDYLVRYPTSDKADQAQTNIVRLGQKQTHGAYDIALFYEREHPPDRRAAFIYYNEVVREDPNSAEAQKAKKRIAELRPIVNALPGGAGPDGVPAIVPQTIASGPSAPAVPGAGTPDGAMPSAAGSTNAPGTPTPDGSTTPGGTPSPADSSTPGGAGSTAADNSQAVPATPATDSTTDAMPGTVSNTASPDTNNAPAPASAPTESTPLPQ